MVNQFLAQNQLLTDNNKQDLLDSDSQDSLDNTQDLLESKNDAKASSSGGEEIDLDLS